MYFLNQLIICLFLYLFIYLFKQEILALLAKFHKSILIVISFLY